MVQAFCPAHRHRRSNSHYYLAPTHYYKFQDIYWKIPQLNHPLAGIHELIDKSFHYQQHTADLAILHMFHNHQALGVIPNQP